jgi:hypothetical protein
LGVAGDAAFYYEKNIDENLLMFAKDSISTIMNGQGSIVYDDMPQLNQLFKFDTGRRLFCFMLQYAVDKVCRSVWPFPVPFLLHLCHVEGAQADNRGV